MPIGKELPTGIQSLIRDGNANLEPSLYSHFLRSRPHMTSSGLLVLIDNHLRSELWGVSEDQEKPAKDTGNKQLVKNKHLGNTKYYKMGKKFFFKCYQ